MTRILAVEDSPTQAEKLRGDLTSAGFTVTMVSHAADALEMLTTSTVDLLLTDVVMPDMDGFELCRAVKSTEGGRDLPVVLLTSLTDPLDVIKGLEAGADNFIRKPYRSADLIQQLQDTIDDRRHGSESRVQLGVNLSFLDRELRVTTNREQILDLLISTFEELVVSTRQVRASESELARLHARAERLLHTTQLERNRLNAVLDSVPVAVVVMDGGGTITHFNQMATQVFETTVERTGESDGLDRVRFVDTDGVAVPASELPLQRAAATGERVDIGSAFDLLISRDDGTKVPVMLRASPVLDDQGNPAGSVGTADLLSALTQHDPVTGLPNRTTFIERIAGALSVPHAKVAVLLIGLDRLHEARATLDHRTQGDPLLVAASRKLRDTLDRDRDPEVGRDALLAYLGGDQFGVILSGATDDVEYLRAANRIRGAVSDWSERSVGIRVTASVGACFGDEAADSSQLLAATGSALRRARLAGGNRVELFDPAASRRAIDRLQLEVDLRDAMSEGGLHLLYQPQVDLQTGDVLGLEALARWRHAARGPIAPDLFIPLAEESGLILTLGVHLLEAACTQIRTWADGGLLQPGQAVSVNVSAVQLRPELADEVIDVLARTEIDPHLLVLEVTETAAMRDPKVTEVVLERLRGLGVRFSLDDFGTGYSSLAYLSRFSFDLLKLDQTFVSDITSSRPDALIAQSVIALGHSLKVPVVAEGVENEDQATVLRLLGCDQAQGYLFGRPLDPADATRLLVGATSRAT